MAGKVDALYFFLVAVSAFFVIVIAAFVIYFGIRYRRRAKGDVGAKVVPSLVLEIAWTIIPLCLGLVMFAWGAEVYFTQARPPAETLDV
jgi:cytochrome c oxidase subunit 2